MGKSDNQLTLFEGLPDVRPPVETVAVRKPRRTKSAVVPVVVTPAPVVLEPVEPPVALAPIEDDTPKQSGQLEAEELRHRNARADRLEERANSYGNLFLKFAVLYLAAKAGIPVYHYILAKFGLPPMDGQTVSAGIGIACAWYYSRMLTSHLLAREYAYQFEIKFERMSGAGKFATILNRLTNVALFTLFLGIAIGTVLDVFAVATYLFDYWTWMRGTTTLPGGR